MLPNIL